MYVRKNMRKERIMEQNKSQQYEDRQIAKSNGGDVLIEFQDSLNYGETKRIHGINIKIRQGQLPLNTLLTRDLSSIFYHYFMQTRIKYILRKIKYIQE